MAQYNIAHACGHKHTHQIYGPGKERERKIAWMTDGLCPACYQAEQDRKRADAAAQAAQCNQDAGLPALKGSDKQIAWAEQVRADIVVQAVKITYPDPAREEAARETARKLMAWILGQDEASWWIDNRLEGLRGLMMMAHKALNA